MSTDDKSVGEAATFAGQAKHRGPERDVSLGDERTVGGGDSAAGVDTTLGEIEVVDLEARYKPEGTLGQGGMGAVVLATDTRLDRKVAIKRILGEAAGNRMAVQRFLTEAKSIAALNHPNVVQIYDYGRAKDGPFLIMEYVDGGSLLDRCKVGALPLDEAIGLACQLCDGLGKAHDLGIIHRDIKPANVLLTKDGIPKLTDFGLAKAEAGDHGQTMTGAVLGTPDFMPPEQRRDASEVDHRSDLWSLAATVYQMVTGRSPKVIRFNDIPEALQEAMGKALEDRKDARYQSARELRDALKSATGGTDVATKVAGQAAVIGDELQEGQCKACGTINTDVSRKFCKKCGGALRVSCLKCEAQIPVWDTICGECGGNQPQMALETSHLVEASKHIDACDYPAAIKTLETIPEVARGPKVSEMLADIRSRHSESEALIADIAGRVKRKELPGLLPLVERAASLRGDRQDLSKILGQLRERRDGAVLRAREALASGDAKRALAAFSGMVAEEFAADDRKLLEQVRKVGELESRLVEAVAAVKSDGVVTPEKAADLFDLCQAYLQLNPKNESVRTLAAQCRGKASGVLAARIAALPALENSIGMKLKLLPGGTFTMGDAGESHEVTLSRPFYMGVYEVTNAEWEAVMGNVPSQWEEADRPVEQVSWVDAVEFCRKLSELPAEKAAGRVYRLPTEAEWEYACRAGTDTTYSFGDDEGQLGSYGWYDKNSGSQTHAVGENQPNGWGLYDMHGNVWEWCSDWYGEYPRGEVTDPQGPSSGSDRVFRGGGWGNSAWFCRAAVRDGSVPSFRSGDLGFRLALSPSGSSPPEAGVR